MTHLAGPSIGANSGVSIYLGSSEHPNRFPSAFTVANGLNGSTTWNLGQSWWLVLTSYTLTVGDNITVSIVSTTQLLFRVTLPGNNPNLPPQFVTEGTNPTNPIVSQSFTIYAQIVDPTLKANSVYANVSEIPGSGLPAFNKMTYSSVTGLWTLTVANGANAAGTYYVFVNASDNPVSGSPQSNTVAIPVIVGTGLIPPSGVTLSVNPTPPVNGTAATIYARVVNTGASASTVQVTFRAGTTLVGTASGPISAGGTAEFSEAWTPTAVGTVLLTAQANVSGGGAPTGALNVTVYPSVLFIAHSVTAGTRLANNTSAYLEQEIQAAGFPFSTMFVACNVALPAASTYEPYDLVIIDFGSTSTGTCAATPSTTVQGYFTTAMASPYYTSFLILGSSFFSSTTCSSYSANLLTDVGIKSSGTTCFTASTSTTSAITYTATTASGFLSNGVQSLTLNKTLVGSTGFRPYDYFAGVTGHGFLSTASGTFGAFTKGTNLARGAAIASDPPLFMTTLPAPTSAADGLGAGGTEVLYNTLNYLAGISTSSSPGHATPDFAVSGVTLLGISASHLSYVYVTVRGNGPTGGLVTVSLTVNGTLALYNGAPVQTTFAVPSSGSDTTVVLTWQAPGVASYQLAVVAASFDGSLYATMSQLPISVLNQATTFHT